MASIDSALGSRGPSPSELVRARTTAIRHPWGAASRIVCSPSGVRAQFFERAARSTTRRRCAFRSDNVDAVDVVVHDQFLGHDVELSRRSRELQLEYAILR